MLISAIVAASKNRVIGKDNQIPWRLSDDLKYFKRTTLNHCIILGRKNYESIGRPLPKRTNIIVTRDRNYQAEGCVIVHSIEDALNHAREIGETEAFICGGGEIYKQSQELWQKLYYTEVEALVDGDIYFPRIDENKWKETSLERNAADARNEYGYNFRVLERVLNIE